MDLLASNKNKEDWLVKYSDKALNSEVHGSMLGGVVLMETPFHLKSKWGGHILGPTRPFSVASEGKGIKRHPAFAKINYYITK